jgi:hypothetical protein
MALPDRSALRLREWSGKRSIRWVASCLAVAMATHCVQMSFQSAPRDLSQEVISLRDTREPEEPSERASAPPYTVHRRDWRQHESNGTRLAGRPRAVPTSKTTSAFRTKRDVAAMQEIADRAAERSSDPAEDSRAFPGESGCKWFGPLCWPLLILRAGCRGRRVGVWQSNDGTHGSAILGGYLQGLAGCRIY